MAYERLEKDQLLRYQPQKDDLGRSGPTLEWGTRPDIKRHGKGQGTQCFLCLSSLVRFVCKKPRPLRPMGESGTLKTYHPQGISLQKG